jgi:hypothetical protein
VKTNAHNLDQREQRAPTPPSIASIFMLAISTFLAATLAVLTCLYSFQAITPALARVTLVAAFAAIGLLARRWKPTRMIALGWLAGTGFTAAFALAVTLTG